MKRAIRQLLAAAAILAGGLSASAAGAATLNIVGCDSLSGDVATGTITCVTGVAPPPPSAPGAPTGCTALASPLSLSSAGGIVTLSGSCSGGTVAKTTWKRNSTIVSAPDTVPSNSSSSAANYTYTAEFCTNADGTLCTTASAGTVTVAAGATPPPTVGSCTDQKLAVITPYLETNSAVTELTFDGARFVTQGFTGANVVVATIRVPQGESGETAVTAYEYTNTATGRRMWLAKSPCDFSNDRFPYYTASTAPKLPIWIGAGGDPSRHVVMQPGEVWYVMVRNQSVSFSGTVTNTCKSSECNIAIKLY
jgi:hypothetical protein